MKKIIIICALVFAGLNAFAQVQPGMNVEYKKGRLYLEGNLMTDNVIKDTFGEDIYKSQYRSGRKMRLAGTILIPAGAAYALIGIPFIVSASNYSWNLDNVADAVFGPFYYIFSIAASYAFPIVGLAACGTGIGLLCAGNNKLRGMAGPVKKEVRLSAAKSGIGIALEF